MPSKVHDTADGEVVRAAAVSLTSIEAVVVSHETSRKSFDFKASDAIRDELKAQYAQQEYVRWAPIAK